MEQRRADADRHHPPAQHLGESAGIAPPCLVDAPQAGEEKGEIADGIERLGPQTDVSPFAIEIEMLAELFQHHLASPQPNSTAASQFS
jgi:hypothetical protein